jgi:prenyltransferase beta subunit
VFQGCQRYIADKIKNGGWKETYSADVSDTSQMEVALTSLCAGALNDAILSTERQEIMMTLLEARNHDGGWGWADGHDSDVDHTAMALSALVLLSKSEETVPQDVRVAIEQGREFLLQCQQNDGGFSQRPGNHESSAIDASGLAVHALASMVSSTDANLRRAAGFFLRTQNADGGWGDKPGSESDLDSTTFVIQALMGSGETIITINEAETSILNMEERLQSLFNERITVIANERDELAADLKSTERKLQIVEAAVAALVTILSIVLAMPFITG